MLWGRKGITNKGLTKGRRTRNIVLLATPLQEITGTSFQKSKARFHFDALLCSYEKDWHLFWKPQHWHLLKPGSSEQLLVNFHVITLPAHHPCYHEGWFRGRRPRRNSLHLPLHNWQRTELRWWRVSFRYKLCQRQSKLLSRHLPSLAQWFHISVTKPSTSQETIQGKELQFSNAQNKIFFIFWKSEKNNANKNLPYLQYLGCSDPLDPPELSQGT